MKTFLYFGGLLEDIEPVQQVCFTIILVFRCELFGFFTICFNYELQILYALIMNCKFQHLTSGQHIGYKDYDQLALRVGPSKI